MVNMNVDCITYRQIQNWSASELHGFFCFVFVNSSISHLHLHFWKFKKIHFIKMTWYLAWYWPNLYTKWSFNVSKMYQSDCVLQERSKKRYKTFIESNYAPQKSKWVQYLNLDDNPNWWENANNLLVFQTTKDTRLIWFQYRIIHKIKVKVSPLCRFCESTAETYLHLFCGCSHTQKRFGKVQEWISLLAGK